jgi:L-aspartate oxidase
VQFHPTALAIDADPLPLLTEALRGEGAVLVDGAGARFMPAVHPDAELAPRDVVARAIWRRRAAGGDVFLDARRAVGDRFPARFPSVFAECRRAGIDPRSEPMPVIPAAHYFMGGVAVDSWGRASIDGLWACGEIASTGAHGANRLASNSLLEALVFGARVAESARSVAPARAGDVELRPRLDLDPVAAAPELRSELRNLAWEKLGLVRDEAGLAAAEGRLRELWRSLPAGSSEVRNLTGAATLIAAAARRRRESRGAHFRSDHPEPLDLWRTRQTLCASVTPDGLLPRFDRSIDEVPG